MPRTKPSAAQAAHARAMKFELPDIVQFLQETLGQKLVAHIADVDPKTVGRWASGDSSPRPPAEQRLRLAFQVFHLLQEEESPHTIRAWFIGLNPQLDDVAPATAIRDGHLRDALIAARAYIAGG
ncbi:MAG TPA: hypothetical protein VFH54_07505 [Mycobacteriales bacterium]|jgi:hypothetical protein|nr:hypothetical protein [Mycobacteriales bacterium]HET7406686.1 hypothetical protein [Mycobacteriales bacterium]